MVETKKTYQANLENKRPFWFLLGLVLVLAMLFSALEYSSKDGGDDFSEASDLLEDMDLLPRLDRRDMVAAPTPARRPTPSKVLRPSDKANTANTEEVIMTTNTTETDGEGTQEGIDGASDSNASTEETASQPTMVSADNPLNFRVVEQIPEYPGGMSELVKWLTDNLRYPTIARDQGIQGRVVVSFVVNKDGSISNLELAKSAHPLLDKEAMRLMRRMPKWKPGKDKGKPCRTLFAIPIVFKLN